eukprot:13096553-Alexandrium_andersonii.AAC.1
MLAIGCCEPGCCPFAVVRAAAAACLAAAAASSAAAAAAKSSGGVLGAGTIAGWVGGACGVAIRDAERAEPAERCDGLRSEESWMDIVPRWPSRRN